MLKKEPTSWLPGDEDDDELQELRRRRLGELRQTLEHIHLAELVLEGEAAPTAVQKEPLRAPNNTANS